MGTTLIDSLFSTLIAKKSQIVLIFKIFYILLILILFIGGKSVYYQDNLFDFFYAQGVLSGKLALLFFLLSLIPGLTKRFGCQHKLIALLRVFRRHIGISMYLFALIHYSFLKLIPIFAFKRIIPPSLFEVFGILSFFILFFLFATSNDISVKKLGIWWYRLHKLIYISMWFIFLHIALQRLSIWTILAGLTVVLQMISFVYLPVKKFLHP